MKSLYEQFKTNPALEQDGVVLDFGGPKFRVRRTGGANRKYKAIFSAKIRPFSRAIANGSFSEEKSDEVLKDVFFEAVMVDWANVTDEANNPLEFNKANFLKVMNDLPDLWSAIRQEADNIKNFQDETAEADGENLGN